MLERVDRDASETELSLAFSPVLTTGYYSQSLSQSVASRLSASGHIRRSTPPPAPLTRRDEGVVIRAGMSFALGHKIVRSKTTVDATAGRQQRSSRPTGVKQHFRPEAAHTVADTESSALSRAIRDFLGRTDHVMNEWNQLDKSRSSRSLTRHRSTSSRYSSVSRSLSVSSSRYSSEEVTSLDGAANPAAPATAPAAIRRRRSDSQDASDWHSAADTDFGSCQELDRDFEVSFKKLVVLFRPFWTFQVLDVTSGVEAMNTP